MLPLLPPSVLPTIASAVPFPASATQKRQVLLVEDQETIAQMLMLVFSRAEIPVVWAESGAEAEKLFLRYRESIAVALIDFHLPDMDGAELCRRLRVRNPELAILVTSGQRDLARHFSGTQPNTFVSKPYSPNDLVRRVRSWMEKTAPSASIAC